ncbi:hypothetical protein [Pseudoalteromonas sp.]|uniref:hypothetical protein n=1 Tax=Pseudoalteromonas sp. TaxID=53249 RepID=UPI00356366F0
MTKTQKQRDKQIRHALTAACEQIKSTLTGFAYLTHTVDLNNEANSIKVTCYFDDELAYQQHQAQLDTLKKVIVAQLAQINLPIKPAAITFLAD